MSVLDALIARSLPLLPRSLLWRVARRYIAGLSVEEALEKVRQGARRDCRATLDILGENVDRQELARGAREGYCKLLARVAEADLPAGISIKLSQLGVRHSAESASTHLARVLECARDVGRFVRIDMEDSSLTSTTLEIYRQLRARFDHVGVALQAYLRRSLDDLAALLPLQPDVRVCKGIYREPPEIAYLEREEVRQNFLDLLDRLLEGGGRAAVATHDPVLVDAALERLRRLGEKERERHEFQMLLGVGERLRERILAAGMRLRVYVPFGPNWYPYCLRRLRENPTIARYVLRDLLRAGDR